MRDVATGNQSLEYLYKKNSFLFQSVHLLLFFKEMVAKITNQSDSSIILVHAGRLDCLSRGYLHYTHSQPHPKTVRRGGGRNKKAWYTLSAHASNVQKSWYIVNCSIYNNYYFM